MTKYLPAADDQLIFAANQTCPTDLTCSAALAHTLLQRHLATRAPEIDALLVWPDGSFAYVNELPELGHKSDDYEVVPSTSGIYTLLTEHLLPAPPPDVDQATLSYKLTASTGYECTGMLHGILPRQWGRISAAFANQVAVQDIQQIREALEPRPSVGAAMAFALAQDDEDMRQFLTLWNTGCWPEIREEFPTCPAAALGDKP